MPRDKPRNVKAPTIGTIGDSAPVNRADGFPNIDVEDENLHLITGGVVVSRPIADQPPKPEVED